MSIQEQLLAELKAATLERDQPRLDVIRAVKTEIQMVQTSKGFDGEVDDALYQKVIAAYCKKMSKARAEYEKAGDRGQEMAAQLAFEVDYLSRWLPQKLDEEATLALVLTAIAELGVTDPKQAGRVMGSIMKGHGKDVDGGLVNKLVRKQLTKVD
jgi:uncharacterized protein